MGRKLGVFLFSNLGNFIFKNRGVFRGSTVTDMMKGD